MGCGRTGPTPGASCRPDRCGGTRRASFIRAAFVRRMRQHASTGAAIARCERPGRVRPAPFRDSTDPQRAVQPTASTTRSSNRRRRGADSGDDRRDAGTTGASDRFCGPVGARRSHRADPAAGRGRRPGRVAQRPNRRWWDADADALSRRARRLPRRRRPACGARRTCASPRRGLLGEVAGRRVLEVGCGVGAVRALPGRRGARGGRVRPVGRDAGARRRPRAARTGIRVPLVQADVCELPFADRRFDLAFSAFGAIPFVADSAGGDARGGPGAAPRAGAGCSLSTHPMRWAFPDDPGPAGLHRDPVVLRPLAVRGGGRDGRARLRRAPPDDGRPGPGDRRRRAACCGTSSSRSGRTGFAGSGASGRRCAARCFPGTAIFVAHADREAVIRPDSSPVAVAGGRTRRRGCSRPPTALDLVRPAAQLAGARAGSAIPCRRRPTASRR